jgi:hypothetical protein
MSKKMKLIPHLEYEKLITVHKTPQLLHKSASVNLFNRNQAAATDVLKWDSISDDIKLALFNSTMRGLRANFEALTNTPLQVEISNRQVQHQPSTEINPSNHLKADAETSTDARHYNANLLHYLPSKYREAGAKIMDILLKSQFKEISWDESGQVYFRGLKRNDAHIVDLLAYVLRPPSKSVRPPPGISTFIYILKKTRVPERLLGIHVTSKLRLNLPSLLSQSTPVAKYTNQEEREELESEQEQENEQGLGSEGGSDSSDTAPYETPSAGAEILDWKNYRTNN